MSGFQIQYTTTTPNESVTLPLVTGYTYNCPVVWDGEAPVLVTAWDDPNATHIQASPGTYTVEITGACPAWSVNNTHSSWLQWTGIVYHGDAVDFDGWQYIVGWFYGCTNLTSVGTGSIVDDGITNLSSILRGISSLGPISASLFTNLSSVTVASAVFTGSGVTGTIPAGLLDNMTALQAAQYMFTNCTGLVGTIPPGFFDNNISLVSSHYAFYGCSGLSGDIPAFLLRNNTNLSNCSNMFLGCPNLKVTSDVFYADGEQSTRFLNKTVNFTSCFYGTGTSLSDNTVPDLWNCNFGTGTPTHTNWINGHGASTLLNWKNIPTAWDGPTVSAPTINSINDDTTYDKQNILLNTTDSLPFQYNGKVELCDNQDYSLSTIFVEQTVNYIGWSDTQIGIKVNRGSLDLGQAYLFVTTDRGDRNVLGFPITIISSIFDLANNPVLPGTYKEFLGYSESEITSETLSLNMYNFLLYPIRQADSTKEGAYFVKRLFEGPQAVWQKTQDKIFSLKDLWSVTKCPNEALKYLKNIVGWTTELGYITDELDNDTLRRLIASSITLWKRRGREETTLNVLSLISTARCLIWNWFDYRWIIDETEFTEQHQGRDPWMVDNDGTGPYESNLRIVDDGTLNKTLVRNIVKFMRACGERVEIAYIDFLDRFLVEDDTSQWEAIQGDLAIVSNGYASLEIVASQQISIASTEYSDVWNKYVSYWRIRGTGTTGFGVTFYSKDVNNYYAFQLNVSGSYDYTLYKVISGTPTTILEGNLPYYIYEEIWYGIRVHIEEVAGQNRIRIYLDGEEIIDTNDTSTLENGSIGFFAKINSTIRLSDCELFQLPLETDLVDINL